MRLHLLQGYGLEAVPAGDRGNFPGNLETDIQFAMEDSHV